MIIEVVDYCENNSIMVLFKAIKNIIDIIHVIVPILLILSITIKISKIVTSNMDEK